MVSLPSFLSSFLAGSSGVSAGVSAGFSAGVSAGVSLVSTSPGSSLALNFLFWLGFSNLALYFSFWIVYLAFLFVSSVGTYLACKSSAGSSYWANLCFLNFFIFLSRVTLSNLKA